jgi:hypothetical protein
VLKWARTAVIGGPEGGVGTRACPDTARWSPDRSTACELSTDSSRRLSQNAATEATNSSAWAKRSSVKAA